MNRIPPRPLHRAGRCNGPRKRSLAFRTPGPFAVALVWLAVAAVPAVFAGPNPQAEPAIIFYHPDHLGSTNVVTDEEGALLSETVYYPYGAPRHEHAATPQPFDPNYRFSDRERDDESGLQYFGARFHLASIGRFMSFDNWAQNVDVTGAYAYARNNPLRYVDPHGTDPVPTKDGETSIEDDALAPIKHTAKAAPTIVKKTADAAKGKAKARAGELTDPDPAKRTEAAKAFVGEVGSAAGEAGGEKLWDEVDQHWSWAVKGTVIGLAAGGLYAAALADVDLPVPAPGIPLGVGQNDVELKPEIDLAPISADAEQYVPSVGAGLTHKTGPFTQTIKGTFNPDSGFSGAYGMGVRAGPVNFGAAVGGSGKEFKASATISISP